VDHTGEKPRYAVIVRLPRAVEVRIEDAYLSMLGATRPIMGYHVTLLGPFYILDHCEAVTTQRVQAVCQHTEPFAIRLQGLGTFTEQDNNVVYVRIADPSHLAALHNNLLRETEDVIVPQNERYREWTAEHYMPHVTVGLGMMDSELAEFLRGSFRFEIDDTLEVTRLWLVEQRPSGPWQYVAEFALGNCVEESKPTWEPNQRA
jgi:2'-5' RNA ligase